MGFQREDNLIPFGKTEQKASGMLPNTGIAPCSWAETDRRGRYGSCGVDIFIHGCGSPDHDFGYFEFSSRMVEHGFADHCKRFVPTSATIL